MANPQIFVSYSHEDNKQKEQLLKFLAPLESAVEFEVWTDSQIQPGVKWEPAIERALSASSIAILLISANFLSSDFVRRKEVPAVLERCGKEDLRLYPILAKPCAWQAVPWISELQIRPVAAKPVWRSGGRYAADELTRIALELWGIVKLVIQVHEAANEKARQEAEQQRRAKETAIAAAVASSPALETVMAAPASAQSAPLEKIVVDQQQLTGDQQKAQTIYQQIAADAERQKMQRFQILQDLQTKIFEITQDVQINRPKSIDDAYKGWDEYLRQA